MYYDCSLCVFLTTSIFSTFLRNQNDLAFPHETTTFFLSSSLLHLVLQSISNYHSSIQTKEPLNGLLQFKLLTYQKRLSENKKI